MPDKKLSVLIAGCGNMGTSHARAYNSMNEFDITGLVSRGAESRERLNAELGGDIPLFDDFEKALTTTSPDAVCICTYPGTHAGYAIKALESGAHVFVEKPIAETAEDAEEVMKSAIKTGKKLIVGYILRHHPGWKEFVERASELGKPLVMRMNLNQQSVGKNWEVHKSIMENLSPIVDCGVHYVDLMCMITNSAPVTVHAIGARLTEDIDTDMYNYGQLQVIFEDGSVGWYESGWGPMMSEQAYFIKDVIGPKGSVSIHKAYREEPAGKSADIGEHTTVKKLLIHSGELDSNGKLKQSDNLIEMKDEPGHDQLCLYEQHYFLKAIKENLDLSGHLNDAVNSLRIVLAADQSVRSGQVVKL